MFVQIFINFAPFFFPLTKMKKRNATKISERYQKNDVYDSITTTHHDKCIV